MCINSNQAPDLPLVDSGKSKKNVFDGGVGAQVVLGAYIIYISIKCSVTIGLCGAGIGYIIINVSGSSTMSELLCVIQ